MDEERIKKEAKEIMDNFMSALKDIEVEEEFILERDMTYREETQGNVADEDFKQRFLSNAPKTSGDAILANKGSWVE